MYRGIKYWSLVTSKRLRARHYIPRLIKFLYNLTNIQHMYLLITIFSWKTESNGYAASNFGTIHFFSLAQLITERTNTLNIHKWNHLYKLVNVQRYLAAAVGSEWLSHAEQLASWRRIQEEFSRFPHGTRPNSSILRNRQHWIIHAQLIAIHARCLQLNARSPIKYFLIR